MAYIYIHCICSSLFYIIVAFTYTYIYAHIHIYISMQTWTCKCCTYVCIYVCIMHTYVHIDIYLCIYIYMLRNRVWFLSSTCDLANICNYIFRDSNTYFDIHMQDIHTCCLYVCTYIYTGKSTQIYPIKLITVTLKIIF